MSSKIRKSQSAANTDKEEWHDVIDARRNKEYAALFKDDESPMKIAIVVDMWLTGFDVPSLATMYVYKPMKEHNLMQAIARVNRVFPEKEGGLVVDYVGIASALKQAMQDYTNRDKKQFGDPDIGKTALVKFQEKLEICRDQLYGFDYSGWYEGSDPERSKLITSGVNFMLERDKEEIRKRFVTESQLLHNAQTLCKSLLSDHDKLEVTFMDAVRVMLVRLDAKGTTISKHDINERISHLLEQSLQSKGVEVLTNVQFSLFKGAFMEEIKNMKERNLAKKILEGLIKDRIRNFERTNIVQSLKFSEMMNNALSNYLKGLLTNEEVISELLRIAEEIRKCEEEGNELGLTVEEKAFYDALSSPEGVKEAYTNDEFVQLTKELTDQLRKNRTIDWNHKESSRAKMRVMVKRLLKKYHYPPEGQEQALRTVMEQCNKWADDDSNYSVSEPEAKVVPLHKKSVSYLQDDDEEYLMMAAEDYECYPWEGEDDTIVNFFGDNRIILVGCYKNKNYLEWIQENGTYSIRLGRRKGSMEEESALFKETSHLVLYDISHTNDVRLYEIVSCCEMTGEQLKEMNYPKPHPGKKYMTFKIKESSLNTTLLNNYNLIGRVVLYNPNHVKGAPVFLEL